MIDIKNNNRKQLFLDNYIIQEVATCRRTVHKWIKYENNPVFGKELPWKGADL